MFRALFCAVLFVTLVINIIFLFATKDKPPDLVATSTLRSLRGSKFSKNQHSANQRRLFLRSNDFYDYSAPASATIVNASVGRDDDQSIEDNMTLQLSAPSAQSHQLVGANHGDSRELAATKTTTTSGSELSDYDIIKGEQQLPVISGSSGLSATSKSAIGREMPTSGWTTTTRAQQVATSSITKSAGERRNPSLELTPKQPVDLRLNRWLNIRVKSSKSHVYVSVDNNIIYESKSRTLTNGNAKSKLRLAAKKQHTSGGVRDDADYYYNDAATSNSANGNSEARGIHVLVLNQFDGHVMSKRVFDTYSASQDEELAHYLSMIRDGRILVFAIKDEGTFKMAPNSLARKLLTKLGSHFAKTLAWRDMWALVLRKDTLMETNLQIGESLARKIEEHAKRVNHAEAIAKSSAFSLWAEPVYVEAKVELLEAKFQAPDLSSSNECQWNSDNRDEDARRWEFCSRVEGYGQVCDCDLPAPISFKPAQIDNNRLTGVPIIVMASNRPYYLYRMLSSLLRVDGIEPRQVIVFIDGFYDEPLMVCRLLNLRAVQQRPLGQRSARISHHYKSSLTATFELFPEAKFAIIFEEDLDVARDVLVYFNSTLELLETDPSLYCVSAWNDQGYEHTVGNGTLIYRIETMPGLGWMLSRKLYKEELEAQWPAASQPHDWDMWIRTDSVRRGRECLIPDISRTFHFGSSGTNINSYFQRQYFSKHAFEPNPIRRSTFSDLKQLKADSYELLIEQLIKGAYVIANNTTSIETLCSIGSRDNNSNDVYVEKSAKFRIPNKNDTNATNNYNVIFIKMIDSHDFKNWLKLAKCWNIWDLDARGQHKSMWRLHMNGFPTLVIGVPASPYSQFMPKDLIPFDL